ncbi:MAG: hypothetical protein NWE94_09945 [Candidatus Bathyarchaeota archaeon]|nr:hypothetical protein [Candidatus Bathyarchaeota archaeon]
MPRSHGEDVSILNSLGLTLSEAKVFLTLSQLGTMTAKEIAVSSGVAREVVYQIMPKLLKKGMVEEAITSPRAFKAIPMKEAIAILLRRKEEENKELNKKAREILQRHQNKTSLKIEDQQITLIPSGGPKQFRITQEYLNAKKSIDLTFPAGKFIQWSQHYAEWSLKEVIERNIKMRIIAEEELLNIVAAHPEVFAPAFRPKLKYIDFKYVKSPVSVELMIFDKKTALISTTQESNINKMLWLRSNNQFIVDMANSYFENLWFNAKTEAELSHGEENKNQQQPIERAD